MPRWGRGTHGVGPEWVKRQREWGGHGKEAFLWFPQEGTDEAG